MNPYMQPQPGVVDSKTLIDGSTQDQMLQEYQQYKQAQEEKAKQLEQAEFTRMASEAARNPEVLNAVQRSIANNIVGAKMGYRDALAKGDVEAMDTANKLADGFRSQGNAIGWNGAGYGSDVSLEQAAQNLANNDARALSQTFYGMQRPADYYQDRYRMYRDRGASMDVAGEMAQADAERYHDNQLYNLLDKFQTYGKDPRGAINDNGVRLMAMLGDLGGSEMANYITNMYAKPVQNWGWENQLIAAENADRYARGRQMLSGEIQNQLAQNNWERNETTRNNDVQRYLAQAEGMVGIKAMDAQTQAAVRSNIIKPLMENKLVTPEMAASYVATGYLVPKGTAPTKEKEKAPTRAEMGVYNQLADLLETAQNDIRTGAIYSVPDGEGSVEAYRLAVEDAIGKGYLTGSDITKARDYAFMLQYMLAMNADTPDTEWASQAYSNMSPEFKKENADAFNNINSKNQIKDGNQKEFSWEKREKPNGNGGKF